MRRRTKVTLIRILLETMVGACTAFLTFIMIYQIVVGF